MKLLFIGDVVGRPGRRVLRRFLPELREQQRLDLVIANAENAAGGFGLTADTLGELLEAGVDLLTSGNHIWDKKEAWELIAREPRLLRPHNYPEGTPGSGWTVLDRGGVRTGVLNVMGTVFVQPGLDCPFACVQRVLAAQRSQVDVLLLDFHAEATSEKMAMGWFADGRASAVLGTHTHVPTADERILPGGTAYISDVGMTGCYNSVIGMDTAKMVKRFVDKRPERSEVAQGPASLCAVLVDIDETGGGARAIRRVRVDE